VALHTDLPIHRTGVQLLQFAYKAQEHMPRGVKRSLGDKIADVCVEMLDRMALANATRGAERAGHIEQLLKHHRALTVMLRVGHDARYISTAVWAQSVQLLDSIGKQGGGWLKAAGSAAASTNKAPAA
jgi:hypothetical protein